MWCEISLPTFEIRGESALLFIFSLVLALRNYKRYLKLTYSNFLARHRSLGPFVYSLFWQSARALVLLELPFSLHLIVFDFRFSLASTNFLNMGRPRKNARRFHGNRFTRKTSIVSSQSISEREPVSQSHGEATASSSKVTLLSSGNSDIGLNGNRIISVVNILNFLEQLVCSTCLEKIVFAEEKLVGQASTLYFLCGCDSRLALQTSDLCTTSKHFQVNDRLQVSMYEIGCHYEAARNFCGNMDLPPPVSCKSWNQNKIRIHEAFKVESSKSKNKAASEIKEAKGNDVTVSCDGTWQKRGFSSKNGVVTVATVNGLSSKIIDTETLTNHCNKCKAAKNGNETAHTCQKNYEGTAGSMEGEGVKRIFKRSQQQYGLSYVGYLGDGDSKSFKNLSEAEPPIYPGKQIEKLECVGHIQKRMGRKLNNLVFQSKKKIFTNSDGKKLKGIGGKNKLTKKDIYRIQGHYGAAIRKHVRDENGMRNAIWAIFHHRSGDHSMCGEWCPSQRGNLEKANARLLPDFVLNEMRPVFEGLTSTELLSRCTHGGTQNVNESFHHIIWSLCPKEIFVGWRRLDIAVSSATLQYNEGKASKLAVCAYLGLSHSKYHQQYASMMDKGRIKGSLVTEGQKAKRRKNQEATSLTKPSSQYGPGICENTE